MTRRPLTEAGSHSGTFGPTEWALLSGVALIWGASFLGIEIALEDFHPWLISWLRIVFGFVTLPLFAAARRTVDREDYGRVGVLGLTWVAIPFMLFPIAQQHIDSALAGMLNALVPIFAGVIGAILLRAWPKPVHTLGIVIGFVGAAGISFPALGESDSTAFGVGLIALATVFYGLSLNLAVPLQQRYGAPAVMVRALGLATVVTAPFGIIGIAGSEWTLTAIGAVAFIGFIGTGLPFVLMAAFVGRVGAARAGVPIYLIPIVSIVLGVTFLDERVAALQILGTGLVLVGAYLSSRSGD